MKYKKLFLTIFFFSLVYFLPKQVFSHPGRTASDGCHFCRTNCEKWGEVAGERHCHNGGTTPVVKPTTPPPVVQPTARPINTPIPKPTAKPVNCSANSDGKCPSQCKAGNDADCCTQKLDSYSWYMNWGCYPTKLSCSSVSDGVCDKYCTAGNDADCCVERLDTYMWYDNWGCYPKE